MANFNLRLQCADRPGLVDKVASFLARQGCNITDAQQYNDPDNERSFMRVVFTARNAEALAGFLRVSHTATGDHHLV